MFEIEDMTEKNLAEASHLMRETYEKDIALCKEKPNFEDVRQTLSAHVHNEGSFMFVYKEDSRVLGICGFLKMPSIVDRAYSQAIEIACNPLWSLSKVRRGKIYIRMIEWMESIIKDLGVNMFIMTVPCHFNNGQCLNRRGYRHMENYYVKEMR